MRNQMVIRNPLQALDQEFGRFVRHWMNDDNEAWTGSYPVDIYEDENNVYVEAELPGYTREQVQVTLEKGILSIVAERGQTQREGREHLTERRFTRVARNFTMPNTVDENNIQATLSDGVLRLTLKKRDEVKPRRIEVR